LQRGQLVGSQNKKGASNRHAVYNGNHSFEKLVLKIQLLKNETIYTLVMKILLKRFIKHQHVLIYFDERKICSA